MRFLLTLALISLPVAATGCSCDGPVDPDGGRADVGAIDAPSDVLDGSVLDAPVDVPNDVALDGPTDDAPDGGSCAPATYPVDYTPTRVEREMVMTAATAFTTATGATPTLNDVTGAVTGFDVPFALTVDASITDPCLRARDALDTLFATYVDLFHMPEGMVTRACSYDSITDAEIVRISGGVYDGRPLRMSNGATNDLVAHVTRSGNLRFFGGDYIPAYQRPDATPCFAADEIEDHIVGDMLGYTRFAACTPTGAGSIDIDAADTRTAGRAILFSDDTGAMHWAREIEVYLAPSRVTSETINSDLYCCPGTSVMDCVGATLVVDEITGEILAQIPNCTTC